MTRGDRRRRRLYTAPHVGTLQPSRSNRGPFMPSMPSRIAVAFMAALVATSAFVDAARASACCGVGHGVALPLSETENAAFLFSLKSSARVGSWSSSRSFAAPPEGDFDREIQAEIGWTVRASRRLELGVTVPMLYTFRHAGDLESTGGGVGDVGASARFRLPLPSTPAWIPSVSLTFGAMIPTGRSASESTDRLAADATGLGAAEFRPGLLVEKSWGDGWLATASISLGFRTLSRAPGGIEIGLAPRLQAIAAVGPSWSSGLSLAAGLGYEREPAPALNSVADPEAKRERSSAILFAAYDFDARLTLVGSSQIDLPITGLGRNESASVAITVGVRRAWSFYD